MDKRINNTGDRNDRVSKILTISVNVLVWPVVFINVYMEKFHVVTAGVAFLLVINLAYLYYRRNQNFQVFSTLLLLFLAFISLYFFYEGGIDGAGHLWVFLFPLLAFELKGHKEGLLFVFAYFSLLIFTFGLSHFLGFAPEYQTMKFIAVFFLVVTAITIFLYAYKKKKYKSDKELLESKGKFEALFNDLSLGVVMIDKSFTLIESNRTMKRWFPDMHRDEKSCCFDALHPENNGKPCVNCPVALCLSDAKTHQLVQKKNTPTGERYYRLVANPMINNLGDVYAVIETLEDITDQKLYQIEILKREEAFRSLVSSLSDIIFTLDHEHRYMGVFGDWVEKSGFTPEFFLGKTNEHVFGTDYAKIHHDAIEQGLKGNIITYDWQIPDKGEISYFQTTVSPLKNAEKKIIGIVCVARDLTEKVKAEKINREISSRYQTFIDASNTGAWEYDSKTGNLWCSKQYFSMLGYEPEEFESSGAVNADNLWEQLVHPDELVNVLAYLRYYLHNPLGTYEQYFRMLHKDGYFRWVLSRGKLLQDEKGDFTSIFVGTHIDITAQKESEETIINKNKELESYLYIASHDLRSPLINIQGFSNKVQKSVDQLQNLFKTSDPDDIDQVKIEQIIREKIPGYLSFVLSNVSKMDSLINALLAVSRTGRILLVVKELDMNALFQKVVGGLEYQINREKASISVDDLHPCYGDANLLNQLFSNLLANALKYRSKDVKPEIQISSQVKNAWVEYCVKDNGIGIAAKDQQKIWDVFYRVDPRSYVDGDGIGLNLVAKIAEKHKGLAWVESEPGKGSSFYVRLHLNKFDA